MADFATTLSVDEVERLLSAPERLMRATLEAEEHGHAALHDGSPIAAREWFDAALSARRLASSWVPDPKAGVAL